MPTLIFFSCHISAPEHQIFNILASTKQNTQVCNEYPYILKLNNAVQFLWPGFGNFRMMSKPPPVRQQTREKTLKIQLLLLNILTYILAYKDFISAIKGITNTFFFSPYHFTQKFASKDL